MTGDSEDFVVDCIRLPVTVLAGGELEIEALTSVELEIRVSYGNTR